MSDTTEEKKKEFWFWAWWTPAHKKTKEKVVYVIPSAGLDTFIQRYNHTSKLYVRNEEGDGFYAETGDLVWFTVQVRDIQV